MNNIILCGFMGAGKTTIGKALSQKMGYKYLDTDELIENEQGISIKEIFNKYGEQYFRDLEHEVCKKITNIKNIIVSTGGGLMTYQRNSDILKMNDIIFFLDTSFDTICNRISNSDTRPLFKDIDKAKVLYDERKPKYYSVADFVINGDMSVDDIVLKLEEILNEKNNVNVGK